MAQALPHCLLHHVHVLFVASLHDVLLLYILLCLITVYVTYRKPVVYGIVSSVLDLWNLCICEVRVPIQLPINWLIVHSRTISISCCGWRKRENWNAIHSTNNLNPSTTPNYWEGVACPSPAANSNCLGRKFQHLYLHHFRWSLCLLESVFSSL